MRDATFPALACLTLAACASDAVPPQLLPRAAEAIDPRVTVLEIVNDRPATPALIARLDELLAQARSGDALFQPLADQARSRAASAGSAQSESWIVAQESLSAAVAARADTTRALAEIDSIAARALQTQGGLAPSDMAAIQSASASVSAIARRQEAAINAVEASLRR